MAQELRSQCRLMYPAMKRCPLHTHGGGVSLPLALARWTVTRQRELQYRAVDITAVKNRPQFEHDAWNRGGFSGGLRDLEDRFLQASEQYPGPRTRWQ